MSELKSNNEFDSLEAFFNKRLKDASLEPADGAWMQIEEELNKQGKQKRRRKFLWFFSSALVLLCGLASLWYFMPKNKTQQNTIVSTPAKKENTKQVVKENPVNEISKETTIAENKNETPTENLKTNETINESAKSGNIKIQLLALNHKANPALFNKILNKVIEVKGNDGYVRYFAVVTNDKNNSLDAIKKAGFKDAFIKEYFDATSQSSIVKNEGVQDNNLENSVATKTTASENKTYSPPYNFSKTNTVAIVSPIKKTTIPKVLKGEPVSTAETETPVATNSTANKTENNSTHNNPVTNNNETKTATQTKIPISLDTKTEETKTAPTENKNEVATTKSDSTAVTNPTQIATTENKSDSVPKKEELSVAAAKSDSSITPTKNVSTDSSKKIPFIPEWAVLLTGGPNIFLSNTQSNLFTASNETQHTTYNGEAKLQFRPFKYFSFSGGANFTYYTTSLDATSFQFKRNQQNDFLFYSSYGSMAVPMTTMLQGFSLMAPVTYFNAKYSYTASLQTINIPIEANLHFLNKSKFGLYLGLGANSSYVLSQQSHLTIIKENLNNDINYNTVTVNKFNMMLMMSLGCDIKLNKHLYITGGPSLKYGITNMSTVSGTNYSPIFISVNAGLKFKF